VQVLNYVQLAWGLIITENNLKDTEIYHGAVEAIYTIIGKFCVCVCVCVECFFFWSPIYINNFHRLKVRHGKARRRILRTVCCKPTELKNKKICVTDWNTRNSDELWLLCIFIYFTVIDLYSYDFNCLQCIYSVFQAQWKQKVDEDC